MTHATEETSDGGRGATVADVITQFLLRSPYKLG